MSSSSHPIQLNAHLALAMLPELLQSIREALAQGRPLVLDGSAVLSIDGATLQLLLATFRTAKQENIPCSWHQPPASPLRKAAALLGITDALSMEEIRQ